MESYEEIAPSEIYFSQDSISNHFGKATLHHYKLIGETLDDILSGACTIKDIPKIRVRKNNRGLWITADNRRLWIFKKLQNFGKCDKISVEIAKYNRFIFRGKHLAEPSIRVKGDEGGYLWRTWATESSIGDTTRNTRTTSREVQASLHSLSLWDLDVPEFQTVAESSVKNSGRSYHNVHSENKSTKYSAATSLKHEDPEMGEQHYDKQTGMIAASRNELFHRRKFASHASERDTRYTCENLPHTHSKSLIHNRQFQSGKGPVSTGTPFSTSYASSLCESSDETARSLSAQEIVASKIIDARKKIVLLDPLGIGFADIPHALTTCNGVSLGNELDELCTPSIMSMLEYENPLNVFKYEDKYYSTDSSTLWILQVLERFTGNVKIAGTLAPKPPDIPINALHDSFRSINRVGGKKWKSLPTLKSLSTKRKMKMRLSDVFFTTSNISDTFEGTSIAKRLVEVFTDGTRDHELNVMEFENQYYTLENRKLWILKQAEKVLGKLNITGNVKISMDYILFHSFTNENIKDVDINLTRSRHTDEQRFILEYIHKCEKKSR